MNKEELLKDVVENKDKFIELLEGHEPLLQKEEGFQALVERATQKLLYPVLGKCNPEKLSKVARIFCKNTIRTYLDTLEEVASLLQEDQIESVEADYKQLQEILKEWK